MQVSYSSRGIVRPNLRNDATDCEEFMTCKHTKGVRLGEMCVTYDGKVDTGARWKRLARYKLKQIVFIYVCMYATKICTST